MSYIGKKNKCEICGSVIIQEYKDGWQHDCNKCLELSMEEQNKIIDQRLLIAQEKNKDYFTQDNIKIELIKRFYNNRKNIFIDDIRKDIFKENCYIFITCNDIHYTIDIFLNRDTLIVNYKCGIRSVKYGFSHDMQSRILLKDLLKDINKQIKDYNHFK